MMKILLLLLLLLLLLPPPPPMKINMYVNRCFNFRKHKCDQKKRPHNRNTAHVQVKQVIAIIRATGTTSKSFTE
jgi:hypothetical protein